MRSLHTPRYRLFVERLRAARGQARMTQVDAAKNLGVPQSFVSKIESGERRVDFVEVERLADLYKVPLEFFSTRGGDERKDGGKGARNHR